MRVSEETGYNTHMTEQKFACMLQQLIDTHADTCVEGVDSYEAVGMLTQNQGMVVYLEDGSEFQITIVRSRAARS